MEQPFEYIKTVQANFDHSRIKLTEDFKDTLPQEPKPEEWKVYFEGSFTGSSGCGRAGREIPMNRQFEWGGETWLIPAVYSCAKGLVIDFCVKVPHERVCAFTEKCGVCAGRDDEIDEEQRIIVG